MKSPIALCLLAFALACARKQDLPEKDRLDPAQYYPLAVGNRWIYEGTFLGGKLERRIEVVKLDGGFFVDSEGARLTADAFGVRDDKRYLLREPLEAGGTWTNVVSVSSVEHYRVLEAGLSCETPAGHFERCVRVEGRNRIDEKVTLVNEMTFAPGVGLVRMSVFAESDGKRIPQTNLALREYQLARPAKSGAP